MNHTAKVEPTKKEARKLDLKAMTTSDLLNYGHTAPDGAWNKGGEAEGWWEEIRDRIPFDVIENDKLEQDDLEEARKDIMLSVNALSARVDELWKALRTHHHTEGRVVREV